MPRPYSSPLAPSPVTAPHRRSFPLAVPAAALPDIGALTVLAVVIVLFHLPAALTDAVLTDYDLFAYFYPYWEHRAAAFREGVLPLWNPYLFTGVPFLANPQAGVLYPLNWPLSWLIAPKAVAFSYLFHLWLAGAGMYWLLRSAARCAPLSAGAGAVVLSLGGTFAAHAGHINQVQAAAWLPWLVLALFQSGMRWTLAGACFYAMAFLAGHPQQVFISSGALALVAAWQSISPVSGRGEPPLVIARSGRAPDGGGRRGNLAAWRARAAWLRTRMSWRGEPPDVIARSRRAEEGSRRRGNLAAGRTMAARLRSTMNQRRGLRLPLPAFAIPFLRLAAMVAGGLGIAGAQLLPGLELSAYSVRSGGLPYSAGISFSLPPTEFLRTFLPTYGDQANSEYIAYTGVTALLLACYALWRGRPGRVVGLFALIAATGVLLALGRFTPVYAILYNLPGFDLFRAPARWLLLFSFGVAGLAGLGVRAVCSSGFSRQGCGDGNPPALVGPWRVRPGLLRASFALGVPVVAALILFVAVRAGAPLFIPPAQALVAWAAAAVVCLLAFALTRLPAPMAGAGVHSAGFSPPEFTMLSRFAPHAGVGLLPLVLATELLFARSPLPVANPAPPASYTAVRPALAHLLQDEGLHRTLSIAEPSYQPGDLRELRESLPEFTPLQLRELVTALKYRETVAPNLGLLTRIPTLDGYDGGVLPLRRFAALKSKIVGTTGVPEPANPADAEGEGLVIIRDRALGIPDLSLMAALNVKYVIADRIWDVWVDGVYHDLGVPQRLAPGDRLALDPQGWPPATAVSVVSYLDGAEGVEGGAAVARIVLEQDNGDRITWDLRAGIETAESRESALAVSRHGPAWRAGSRRWDPAGGVYAARMELRAPGSLRSVVVESLLSSGSFTLAGFAVVDGRTQASYSPPVNAGVRRVLTADLKVYENVALQPRVTVARDPLIVPDERAQLQHLSSLAPGQVILPAAPPAAAGSDRFPEASGGREAVTRADTVQLLEYKEGRITAGAHLAAPGYLVVSDSFYPGWSATVDGEPAEVLRANYMFRAVPVPAGDHQVTLRYEPDSLKAGLALSATTLLAMGALWSFRIRRA